MFVPGQRRVHWLLQPVSPHWLLIPPVLILLLVPDATMLATQLVPAVLLFPWMLANRRRLFGSLSAQVLLLVAPLVLCRLQVGETREMTPGMMEAYFLVPTLTVSAGIAWVSTPAAKPRALLLVVSIIVLTASLFATGRLMQLWWQNAWWSPYDLMGAASPVPVPRVLPIAWTALMLSAWGLWRAVHPPGLAVRKQTRPL